MLSWEIMSQLFPFVMSSVGEIYLLNASALLSPNALLEHRGIYPRCDCSLSLQQWDEFKDIFGSTWRCFLKIYWIFRRLLAFRRFYACAIKRRGPPFMLQVCILVWQINLNCFIRSERRQSVDIFRVSICIFRLVWLFIQISFEVALYKQYNVI